MKKEIDRLEQVNVQQRGRIIMLERQNTKLRAALTYIAGVVPVTDQSTSFTDDSCQATAREALT